MLMNSAAAFTGCLLVGIVTDTLLTALLIALALSVSSSTMLLIIWLVYGDRMRQDGYHW